MFSRGEGREREERIVLLGFLDEEEEEEEEREEGESEESGERDIGRESLHGERRGSDGIDPGWAFKGSWRGNGRGVRV